MRDAVGDGDYVKYYSIAGQRLAMQDGEGVKYLLTDHLGSIMAITDDQGELPGEQRYKPFGEPRFAEGITETDFGFTGQRALSNTDLFDYKARFYNPLLSRFVSPDTLIPNLQNPAALNRYSYTYNNPIKFSDPNGHGVCLDSRCELMKNSSNDRLTVRHDFVAMAQSVVHDLAASNSLEAMATIIDAATTVYKDYNKMLPALTRVFTGSDVKAPLTLLDAGVLNKADGCAGVGRDPSDCEQNLETDISLILASIQISEIPIIKSSIFGQTLPIRLRPVIRSIAA